MNKDLRRVERDTTAGKELWKLSARAEAQESELGDSQ